MICVISALYMTFTSSEVSRDTNESKNKGPKDERMIGAEMTCRASKAFDLQYEFSFLFMSSPFVSTENKVLVRSATHTMSWTTQCYRSTARAETMRGHFFSVLSGSGRQPWAP